MTAGALAEALHLSRSAVTTVIDRLESLRYARRVRGNEDRRQVVVELTPSSGAAPASSTGTAGPRARR